MNTWRVAYTMNGAQMVSIISAMTETDARNQVRARYGLSPRTKNRKAYPVDLRIHSMTCINRQAVLAL